LGAAWFFRAQLGSGFDTLMGDDGDGRLSVALHEHWYAVLRGQERWDDQSFFHPLRNVLGFTDTHFVNQVIYVPLRALGVDPFLAFQLTLVILSGVGFGSLYVVLRRHLQVRRILALGGCLLYCFGNNLALKVGQPQHLTSWWTPLCLLAGLTALRHRSRLTRLVSAEGCGVLAGCIIYSSFYVGWTAVFAIVLATLAATAARPRRAVAFARKLLRDRWQELLVAAGGALVVGIGFVRTYQPTLDQYGGRPYEEVGRFAPRPGDLVNVSGTNYLWRSTLHRIFGAANERLVNGERSLAVTPLLMLVPVVLAVVVVRAERRAELLGRVTTVTAGAVSLVAAALALALLPVWVGGHSAWYVVWAYVPGGSAIRATARIQVVGSQLMAIALAALLSRLLDLHRPRRRAHAHALGVTAMAVVSLLCLEQLNLAKASLVDRPAQLAALALVPPPPAGCTSFFILSPGAPIVPFILEIDAILVAQRTDVPTLNGYSGQIPPGWMLDDVQFPPYRDHVRAWAAANGVTQGVCSYDRTTHTWAAEPMG
jgi:hypothetical protein